MRKPLRTVTFRLARAADVQRILKFLRDHGEGKVDLRDIEALLAAIAEGSLFVFIAEGDVVIATAGAYSYCGGCLVELGSSVWHPAWRGEGGADQSVILRVAHTVLTLPNAACVSELYLESLASAAVLGRHGFEEVEPNTAMNEHAIAASSRPVRHFAISPLRLPKIAADAAAILRGHYEYKGRPGLRVKVDPRMLLRQPSALKALDALAGGDLSVAGWHLESPTYGENGNWLRRSFC